jgi:mono/diheme cytochrome c family protein
MRRPSLPNLLLCVFALALPFALAGAAGADAHAAAYEASCASCHGADGTADTPVGKAMKIPSFADTDLAAAEPEAICEKVRGLAKHAAMLKKVDEADLLAACKRVKELAAGS